MNDTFMRYVIGSCLIFCAGTLDYLGASMWSLLPATAGVYVLGALLLEKIREIK